MIGRLIGVWHWVGAHRLLAGWVVAALAVLTFGGGVALGAASEQPAPVAVDAGDRPARKVSTVVEAVILGRQGATLVARTRDGELLYIRTHEATRYRLRNRAADATVVRRGSRVVVVGRPIGDGLIRARAISVRR
jgi:hypothetical protein